MVSMMPERASLEPKVNISRNDAAENVRVGRHDEKVHSMAEDTARLVICCATMDHTPNPV